jgi:hypothetical protein
MKSKKVKNSKKLPMILSDDYCQGQFKKDCLGNLNIPRENMPQILDYPLGKKNIPKILKLEQQAAVNKILRKMLNTHFDDTTIKLLKSSSITPLEQLIKDLNITENRVKLSDIIPIQKEIRLSSTKQIIKFEINKEYINHITYVKKSIKDGRFLVIKYKQKYYILDGHHRWSALKQLYPNISINVNEIKSNNIKNTINKINKFNYVYNESFDGQVFL